LSTNNNLSDKELFSLVANGDHDAYKTLLRRHRNNIFAHAMIYLKDSFKAQDIVQEVFLSIWKDRKRLALVAQPENYLFIIARNKIVSELRKKMTLPLDNDPDHTTVDPLSMPDKQLENKERAQMIVAAIQQMPPQRRKVFELNRKHGLKYEEIAKNLNISPNTVKVHMVQALAFIRSFIGQQGPIFLIILLLF
jgi:RNA polymerase sigma-70 factor (family 1)